ncbi:hypothetical protein [Microvirga sp. 2TAF3]|uniref:hypothetical protein n=1 Tax=Microvirga sp. 2TAF3 TaxID=3233014 RepID=UPI003F9547A4
MDSTQTADPSILVIENDAGLREPIATANAAALDGLSRNIELSGPVVGGNVGAGFNLLWLMRPVVYASSVRDASPGFLRQSAFPRKSFEIEMLTGACDTGSLLRLPGQSRSGLVEVATRKSDLSRIKTMISPVYRS